MILNRCIYEITELYGIFICNLQNLENIDINIDQNVTVYNRLNKFKYNINLKNTIQITIYKNREYKAIIWTSATLFF